MEQHGSRTAAVREGRVQERPGCGCGSGPTDDDLDAVLGDARAALVALAVDWPGDADRLGPLRAAHDRLTEAVVRHRGSRDRHALLADASTLLLSDLDPDAVLERLAALAVPDLAQWCTVWLPVGAGSG